MIQSLHELLAQQPWCFHPEQIATLTDWQIERLYARAALQRAERWEAEHAVREPSESPSNQNHHPGSPPEPTSPHFREWVLSQFQAMGLSRNEAESRYAEQANPR